MKFSKYNSEHYLNLTAYEAMVNIDREERARRFRPLVYICSPYAGDVETNTKNARRYSRFAIESHTIPIDLADIFRDCTEYEKKLILDIAKEIKRSHREHRPLK